MQKRTTSSNARKAHCSISEASPAACVMGDLLTVLDSAHAAPLHPRLPFFHSVPSVESKDNPRWIVLSNEPSTFRAPSSCTDGHTCSESGHFAWHGSQRIIGMSQITVCDLPILSQLRSYTHLNMPRFNVDLARNLLFIALNCLILTVTGCYFGQMFSIFHAVLPKLSSSIWMSLLRSHFDRFSTRTLQQTAA